MGQEYNVANSFSDWRHRVYTADVPSQCPPQRTDERFDRRSVRVVLTSRTATANEIRATVTSYLSIRTITNRLLAVGLRSHDPLTCLLLSPHHRRQRFCGVGRECIGGRYSSDECHYCFGQGDICVCVRRGIEERENPWRVRTHHSGYTLDILVRG